MNKTCASCKHKSITLLQVIVVGFGGTINCRQCSAKLRLGSVVQTILSITMPILTLILFVSLTNAFGMIGFVLAFIIPVIVSLLIPILLPLKLIKSGLL